MSLRFLLLICILAFALTKNVPIIGIVSSPYPDDTGDLVSSRIIAEYVRWLENAGAMTMAIHSWYSTTQLDDIMSKVNGVILLGGDRNLDLSKPFEKVSAYILQKVIESYDKGNPITLWGTCQGFELLHSLIMNTIDLRSFDANNLPFPLLSMKRDASMFKYFSATDFQSAETEDDFAEFHFLGIEESQYVQYPTLSKMLQINALAKDRNGKVYVSAVQGIKYPIYAVQFHPEMISANRTTDKVPTGTNAVRFAEHLANFFMDEARKNNNNFEESDLKKYHFIDSFIDKTIYEDEFYFYVFSNDASGRSNKNFLELKVLE
jgi:gamma-glutamyl hydrolase